MDTRTPMSFARYGRTFQLCVAGAEGLRHVLELDKALWVCTSAPVSSLRCDETFLQCIAGPTKDRIGADDLETAIRWTLEHLRDTSGIDRCSETLIIGHVADDAKEGKRITAAARKMLATLGADEDRISLEQVRQIKHGMEQTPVSEAGVALPAAGADEVQKFLHDIVAVEGGVPHPSGKKGVDAVQLNAFGQHVTAFLDWFQQGQVADGPDRERLFPLGDGTEAANALVQRLAPRINAYFDLCRTMRYYAHWEEPQKLRLPDLSRVAGGDAAALQEAPISSPSIEGELALDDTINPSDAADVDRLRREIVEPLLSGSLTTLDAAQWEKICVTFQPFDAWHRSRPEGLVATLGIEAMTAYRDGAFARKVQELIERSKETSVQLENVRLVEKLLLCQVHMVGLVNNFVSFPHLYDPNDHAMFEVGSLIADGRHFNMAVQVADRAAHARLSDSSRLFVMYVQLERAGGKAALEVAVPVTAGDQGNLVVGKRGIFVDTEGLQWDARVMYIVENPVSLWEAMTAPFKRIGNLVGGKIEKFTGSAEKKLDQTTQSALTDVGTNLTAKPTTEAQAAPSGERRMMIAGGMLAGGGVALAALGSAAAFVTKTVGSMQAPQLAVAVLVALCAVLLPTTLLAVRRLRQRDLSAVLEGAGWAINARMRLTRAQSLQFTHRPACPPGVGGHSSRWLLYGLLCLVLIAGAVFGYKAWRPSPAEGVAEAGNLQPEMSGSEETAPADH